MRQLSRLKWWNSCHVIAKPSPRPVFTEGPVHPTNRLRCSSIWLFNFIVKNDPGRLSEKFFVLFIQYQRLRRSHGYFSLSYFTLKLTRSTCAKFKTRVEHSTYHSYHYYRVYCHVYPWLNIFLTKHRFWCPFILCKLIPRFSWSIKEFSGTPPCGHPIDMAPNKSSVIFLLKNLFNTAYIVAP